MAHSYSRLAGLRPADIIDNLLYTSGAAEEVIATLNVCNMTGGALTYRVALTSGGAPAATDWLEYDKALAANVADQITGLCIGNSQRLYVQASAIDSIVFVLYGLKIT